MTMPTLPNTVAGLLIAAATGETFNEAAEADFMTLYADFDALNGQACSPDHFLSPAAVMVRALTDHLRLYETEEQINTLLRSVALRIANWNTEEPHDG